MKKMKESSEVVEVEREPESMLTKIKNKGKRPLTDRQLLVKMYEIFSPSGGEHAMVNFVSAYLTEKEVEHEIDSMGNIYCKNHVEGDNRVLLNAHMDTVASAPAKIIAVKTKDESDVHIKSSNNQVIGADDKNGIFVTLKLLTDKRIKSPLSVLFCVAEESGCNGSLFAMEHHAEWFADCIFCITIDRRGNTDIVTSNFDVDLCSKEMEKTLGEWGKDFGLDTCDGSISDVSNIVAALKINGINLFAGYYNAHSGNEYTSIKDLGCSLRFARYLIPMIRGHFKANPKAINYTPVSAYRPVIRYGGYGYGGWESYGAHVNSQAPDDERDDAHGIFLDCIEDIEAITQQWFVNIVDADFKLSKSGKSLIFPNCYTKHKEEWDALNVYLDCEKINGNDVAITIKTLEEYDLYYKYRGWSEDEDDDAPA